jgi:hypothetical protein
MLGVRGGIIKPRAIRVKADAIGQPKMTEIALLEVSRSIQLMEAIVKFQREFALLAIRRKEKHKLLLLEKTVELKNPNCEQSTNNKNVSTKENEESTSSNLK